MHLFSKAVGKQRGSDPSQAPPILTAKAPSKGFFNKSKRKTSNSEIVSPSPHHTPTVSGQTASSGVLPGPYYRDQRETTTRIFSQPIPVGMDSVQYPTSLRDFVEASYQPPPPVSSSRMPASRPLPAPPKHPAGQSSPVREKRYYSRLSDTNPIPPRHPSYPPLPKYSPREPEQNSEYNAFEMSPKNSPTSPSSPFTALHPGQQPHLPAYSYDSNDPYFQRPHEEDQHVYPPRPSSSDTNYTAHSPITSHPAFQDTMPGESSSYHSLATPIRLEFDPSTPINPSDYVYPSSPIAVPGRSGNMYNEQLKGPPSAPKVYPPGRSVARPKNTLKVKGGGSDAPKLRVSSDTPSNIPGGSGTTNLSPLSDVPMPIPMLATTQAAQRTTPPASSQRLHPDDAQPSSSSLPLPASTSLRSSLSQDRDTSSLASSTAGAPAPFIYPSGRSRPKAKSKPTVTSHNTEQSRFMGLRLLKDKNKKDSKKPDNGKQREVEVGSDIQSMLMGSGSPPFSNSSSRNLVGTTNKLGAEDLDEELVFDIRRVSNSRETSANVREEHVGGGPSNSKVGNYPLNPFDVVLLEHDRLTGELLRRLNPADSPTFYDYGISPPREVLDLGCGQGHWVVEAAIKWSGYGTKVTGYDKVDISKALLPLAVEHGVTGQVRFVRGNFLKQQLPFEDNTFDLIRMSCLTLCIPTDAWALVFQEVRRVLTPSGRLEVIEDSIIFPPPPLVAAPLNLEFLFEQMLLRTFGISLHPEAFISQLMKNIFGYGELVEVMNLTLARSPPKEDEAAFTGESSSSAGLLLLPSSFFPMEPEELDAHTSKHMRSLLSCKHLLVEYAIETATNEEVDDEMVLEVLYEYESSMHQRLDPLLLDANGQVSESQTPSGRTGTIRTFRVFEAIKTEKIIFTR